MTGGRDAVTGVRASEPGHAEPHQLCSPSGAVGSNGAPIPEVSGPLSLLTPPLSLATPVSSCPPASLSYSPQDSPVALNPNATLSLVGPHPESLNHPWGLAWPSASVLLDRIRMCYGKCVPKGLPTLHAGLEQRGEELCPLSYLRDTGEPHHLHTYR